MLRDPYEVLGLPRGATQEEVSAAYKKLAREKHPDRFRDAKEKQAAQESFKEINQAYERIKSVESDPTRNPFGGYGFEQFSGGQGSSRGRGRGFDSIFNAFFGGGPFGFGSDFGRAIYQTELNVKTEDTLRENSVSLVLEERRVEVKIPAFVRDGQKVQADVAGASVIITVHLHSKEFFRVGNNLLTVLAVSPDGQGEYQLPGQARHSVPLRGKAIFDEVVLERSVAFPDGRGYRGDLIGVVDTAASRRSREVINAWLASRQT